MTRCCRSFSSWWEQPLPSIVMQRNDLKVLELIIHYRNRIYHFAVEVEEVRMYGRRMCEWNVNVYQAVKQTYERPHMYMKISMNA